MREDVVLPEPRVGPLWIQEEHLPAKFIRDAESFERTEALDTRGPVSILALAHRGPVALDELTNAAGDHARIVTSSLVDRLALPGTVAAEAVHFE